MPHRQQETTLNCQNDRTLLPSFPKLVGTVLRGFNSRYPRERVIQLTVTWRNCIPMSPTEEVQYSAVLEAMVTHTLYK